MSASVDAASPLVCAVAIVVLDMGWRDNRRAPLELWQVEEIRLCCGDLDAKRPSTREIERGWKLARRSGVTAAELAQRCRDARAS
jgi:hypothetical protein